MNSAEVALACEAWVASIADGVQHYPEPPAELLGALPLVIADVQKSSVKKADQDLSKFSYEQTFVRVWAVRLLVLVDPGDDVWEATQQLNEYEETIGAGLRSQPTLGGAVQFAAPTYTADYQNEIKWADGTVVRGVAIDIVVGEQIGGQ